MNFGESLVALTATVLIFGMPVLIYAIKEIGKRQPSPMSDGRIGDLQAQLQAQKELTRQLQQRLENLEHVVAGNAYQGEQRFSRALEPQPVSRTTEGHR